jgi:subtilisin family serine protease
LTTTPGADPYLNGDTINFKKSDGTTFSGVCTAGIQFTAADCNTKLISARYYVNGFGSHNILTPEAGEYLSPRDGSGHGSHTASTTAGNHEVPARIDGIDFGTISGVAPAAKIAAYKVCWEGLPQAGCAMSDMLAAVNQAVKDSVDVINFSIGGGAAQTTVSPLDEAFLGAAAAGIFVAASAGNSGSGASTLDHGSPWITTVAASTIPGYEATATLGDGSSYAGASVTVNHTPVSTPLTAKFMRGDIVAVAGHDPADALLCGPGSLDPAQVRGAIVFCERGVYDRVAKSSEVLRAGGVGMLLVNRAASSTDSDTHSLPTIHLDQPYWDATFAYAAHESAKITFTPNNSTSNTVPTPQVAGFSSRGPLLADGSDILKPDITAPGVAILADIANAAGAEPSWGFMSGTSMASPHIAGLAALYFGEHPHATPAEIKSALMTTAYDTLDAQGNSVKDPFMQGAGHANPTKFFNPGMLYLNNVNDWFSYIQGIGYNVGVQPIDPSNLNLASIAIGSLTGQETITRTVTSTQAGVFEAMPITIPGINAVVSPSTLTFTAAGETKTFDVTFTRTDAPLDTFVTGSLDWVSGSTVVHSPIAIQPKTIVAPALVNGTGINGSTSVTVTPGSTGDIPLQLNGLAAGVHQTNSDDPTSPHTGFARAGQQFSYQVEVPEETRLSRFDLVSADKTGDVDLVVYRLNSNGIPVVGWQSATSSPDERIDLVDPTPGLYRVDVFGYYGETPFEITTFSVLPGLNDDGFTAEPPIIPGQQGIPVSYTLSWEGLTPNTPYLGIVDYANSKTATIISVQPGETPPPNGANQHQ